MKTYISTVALDAVVAAQCPTVEQLKRMPHLLGGKAPDLDAGTMATTAMYQPWHEWELDGEELLEVTTQDIDPATGLPPPGKRPDVAIPEVHEHRLLWMRSDHPAAALALAKHEHFLRVLSQGGDIGRPMLLTAAYARQVHDGGHRLLAAYEWSRDRPAFRVRVYWNRAP